MKYALLAFGAVLFFALMLLPSPALTFSTGAPPAHTGAPGEQTCGTSSCHSTFPVNSGTGSVTITAPSSYPLGQTIMIEVNVSNPGNPNRQGFEVAVKNAGGQHVGTLQVLNSATQFAGGDARYITHTSAGNSQTSWMVGWTAPSTDVGPLTIYAAGVGANFDGGRLGDRVYTTSKVMMPPNAPPTVVAPIADQTLEVGDAPFTRDLNTVFADDGSLTYSVSASPDGIVAASVSGSTLTVTAVAEGETTVTVTASDGVNPSVSDVFAVTVTEDTPPVVIGTVDAQTLEVGGSPFVFDLNTLFTDDGALTFSASTSPEGIATASVSGSTLTVTAVAEGTTEVTVTASDGVNPSVSTSFNVMVMEDTPPVVANPIDSQMLEVGGAPFTIDLGGVFTDDGALTFSTSTSPEGIVTAGVSGSTLTVTAVAEGETTVTVTANDGVNPSVSDVFTVTVAEDTAPVVVNPIEVQMLDVGGSPFVVDLSTVFADDGALTFSASTSPDGIATASVSGSTLTVTAVAEGETTVTVTADDGVNSSVSTSFLVSAMTTGAEDDALPTEFALHGAYPNPFRSAAIITFDLPTAAEVSLRIFDTRGREVQTVPPQVMGAGTQRIRLEGRPFAAGVYTYQLTAEGEGGTVSASGRLLRVR